MLGLGGAIGASPVGSVINHAPTMPYYPDDDACEDGSPLPPPPAYAFRVTPRRRPIEELVDGQQANTPFGQCFVATSSTPLDQAHGSAPLSELFHFNPALIAEITRDAAYAGFDLRRAAFLDTETTGLAGGTGTYARIRGHGTYRLSILAIGQKSGGACSKTLPPGSFQQIIKASGPTTL